MMSTFTKVRSTIAASGFIGICIKPCINNVPRQKAGQTLVVQGLCLFTIRPNFDLGTLSLFCMLYKVKRYIISLKIKYKTNNLKFKNSSVKLIIYLGDYF
jgi:hypothetical protein